MVAVLGEDLFAVFGFDRVSAHRGLIICSIFASQPIIDGAQGQMGWTFGRNAKGDLGQACSPLRV